MKGKKLRIGRFIFAALLLLGVHIVFKAPAHAASNGGDVIINEIGWMGTKESSTHEWIELSNTTSGTISLDGWKLYEMGGTTLVISLSGTIGSNSYYLIERGSDATTSVPADLFGSFGGSGLNNNGEFLVLKDNMGSGSIIDSVDFSSGWSAGSGSPDYKTMERGSSGWHTNDGVTTNGTDAGGNPINGTPRAANSVGSTSINTNSAPINTNSSSNTNTSSSSALTNIVLNEIYPNPPTETDEFIELRNTSGMSGSPEGWKIKDAAGNSYTLPASTVASEGIWAVPRSTSGIILNNDTETITLLNPGGATVETLSYSNPTEGQSYARNGNGSFEWTTTVTLGTQNVFTQPTTTTNSASATSNSSSTNTQKSSNTNTTASNSSIVAAAPQKEIVGVSDFSSLNFTEIFPNPLGDDESGEWIEIFNSSNNSVSLAGGSLSDTSGKVFLFPQDAIISSHEFKVFLRQTTGIILNNDEDIVTLKDAAGKKIDSVSYQGGQEGRSYAKIGGTWGWVDPTSGKSNEGVLGVDAFGNTNSSVLSDPKAFGLTINEAKASASRSIITVAGKVMTTIGEVAKNILYIQDATGGLAVVVEAPNYPKLSRGDLVSIKGKMGTVQGEKRLTVEDGKNITVAGPGLKPEAWPMTVQDIGLEALGLFASVQGKVTDRTNQGFVLDDETGFLPVSFASTEDFLSDGDVITARGIVVKTSKGISLVPRDQDDLLTGRVLGDEQSAGQNLSTNGGDRDTINQLLIIFIAVCVGGAIAYWYLQRTSAYETSSTETSEEPDKDQR